MIKRLIQWLRPTFEGEDHKASYRRLSAFIFMLVDIYIIVTEKVKSVEMLYVHYSLLTFILIMTGIITVQNILQIVARNTKDERKNISE